MMPDTNTGKPRKERDRPFPWTCGHCLKDEVYPETMPYAIDVKHDGQLYHLEIPEIRIPKCRACGELIFSYSEDDQILQALRARVRLLTPEQIRGGREALGLKSKQFAEKLGVAAETISRWERGGLIQSRAMDNFLRVFFAFPEVRQALQGTQQNLSLGTMMEGKTMDKLWEKVWDELCDGLENQPFCPKHPEYQCVRTLVKHVINDIIRVGIDGVVVRSHEPDKGDIKEDFIEAKRFRVWWDHLQRHGSASLIPGEANNPHPWRSRVVGAIFALCLPEWVRWDAANKNEIQLVDSAQRRSGSR